MVRVVVRRWWPLLWLSLALRVGAAPALIGAYQPDLRRYVVGQVGGLPYALSPRSRTHWSELVEPLLQRVVPLLQAGHVPGAQIVLTRAAAGTGADEELCAVGIGYADMATRQAMTADTPIAHASFSKLVAAVDLLVHLDRGLYVETDCRLIVTAANGRLYGVERDGRVFKVAPGRYTVAADALLDGSGRRLPRVTLDTPVFGLITDQPPLFDVGRAIARDRGQAVGGDAAPKIDPRLRRIRLRDCLGHTSGMVDQGFWKIQGDAVFARYLARAVGREAELPRIAANDTAVRFTGLEVVRALQAVPCYAEPGTVFDYRDQNYVVLKGLIDKITPYKSDVGPRYDWDVQASVWAPLHVRNAGFLRYAPVELDPVLFATVPDGNPYAPSMSGYWEYLDGRYTRAYADSYRCFVPGQDAGNGGVYLPCTQSATFLNHFDRLLQPATFAAMTTPSTSGGTYGLGCNVRRDAEGRLILGHNGQREGVKLAADRFPGITRIALKNLRDWQGYDLADAVDAFLRERGLE